ncbi:hypothetical protein [Streptomyces rubellomurinus]|uniref:Gram-positive cocci surface proteins LPxTG domain-containing protein n=1 Tax=Streptomyces rubellomurinus (strain ATCC 31215) TaxID=359131 RepID=A0A0F2T8D7_STRR3|nr:hypothetical protein [Streptomyces rubellomurinus]KJS58590.1 hypothetical protein VM95_32470 [Streptomyces rubellomurinus]
MRTRKLSAALALATAAALPSAAPAAAHGGTVRLELSGTPGGHVRTLATWADDHDPVTEGFTGTVAAAASDGRTAGPWRLVSVPDQPGAYATRESLPAGHWRVSVACTSPAPGHDERDLDVDPAANGELAASGASGGSSGDSSGGSTGGSSDGSSDGFSGGSPGGGGDPAQTVPRSTAAPLAAPGSRPVHETTDDATTWAAIGTAAAAVLLVATGLWLRRHARP